MSCWNGSRCGSGSVRGEWHREAASGSGKSQALAPHAGTTLLPQPARREGAVGLPVLDSHHRIIAVQVSRRFSRLYFMENHRSWDPTRTVRTSVETSYRAVHPAVGGRGLEARAPGAAAVLVSGFMVICA